MTSETKKTKSANGDECSAADAPVFVGGKPRARTIALEWPLKLGDKVYTSVTVRRLTVAEIETFVEEAKDSAKQTIAAPKWPPMCDVPPAVLEALDPDDQDAISEAIMDFLPRRLRAGLEAAAAAQVQEAGESTAPSSPPSSASPSAT